MTKLFTRLEQGQSQAMQETCLSVTWPAEPKVGAGWPARVYAAEGTTLLVRSSCTTEAIAVVGEAASELFLPYYGHVMHLGLYRHKTWPQLCFWATSFQVSQWNIALGDVQSA